MTMTKTQAAAKAREAKAAKLQAEAEAGYAEANDMAPTSTPEVASYEYVGGLDAVIVVVDGTSYEFRPHQPMHLAHAVPSLDNHTDFKQVKA